MTMATNDNTFTDYVVGLDLAQTVDYSALAVIERKYREATFTRPRRSPMLFAFCTAGRTAPVSRQSSPTYRTCSPRPLWNMRISLLIAQELGQRSWTYSRRKSMRGDSNRCTSPPAMR